MHLLSKCFDFCIWCQKFVSLRPIILIAKVLFEYFGTFPRAMLTMFQASTDCIGNSAYLKRMTTGMMQREV